MVTKYVITALNVKGVVVSQNELAYGGDLIKRTVETKKEVLDLLDLLLDKSGRITIKRKEMVA